MSAVFELVWSPSEEIAALELRVIAGSTMQDNLNALRVARRRLWMKQNGLGPR